MAWCLLYKLGCVVIQYTVIQWLYFAFILCVSGNCNVHSLRKYSKISSRCRHKWGMMLFGILEVCLWYNVSSVLGRCSFLGCVVCMMYHCLNSAHWCSSFLLIVLYMANVKRLIIMMIINCVTINALLPYLTDATTLYEPWLYLFIFVILFNDSHVLHLRSETVTIHRWMTGGSGW